MNLHRLVNTKMGRVFISIVMGIGLAALFRRTCTDKNCIVFNGPIIKEFDDKIYKQGFNINTPINLKFQKIATETLRDGLISYDKRKGWRGALTNKK